MAIVDPFKDAQPIAASSGIVDPFKSKGEKKIETPGVWSDLASETGKEIKGGWENLTGAPKAPDPGEGFWSGFGSEAMAAPGKALSFAASVPQMLASPITGAIHSFGGRALAGLEGIAGEGAVSGLQRLGLANKDFKPPDREAMYEQAKADIDKAMLAAGPARTGAAVAASPFAPVIQGVARDIDAAKAAAEAKAAANAKPPPIPTETEQSLQRLSDAGTPVDIPRGLTIQNPAVRGATVALSKFPWAGTPLDEAVRAVPGQIGAHVEDIAGGLSPKLEANIVGGGIEHSLSGAATREAAAGKAAAEAADAAAQQKFESEQRAREQAITDRQANATSAAERTFGNVNPMEAAQDTINDVQSAHRQARDRRDRLYGDVNNLDARVDTSAFSGLRDRAEKALVDEGVNIDDPGSNASKMLRELDRLSGQPGELPPGVPPRMMQALQREYGGNVPASVLEELGFPGGTDAIPPDFRMAGRHAPAPGSTAIPVQGLEHLSKRIGRMGMEAETADDRFSSRIIKNAFDDWRNDALGSHLTADSAPNSGPVIDAARASHRDLMDRFGYNYRRLPEGEPRNAAKALNQVVTGGLGPEGLRDNLIGTKPGNRRISAPLYEAISNAVPNAGEFRNRMRGAYWNRIGGGSPESITRGVEGLTPTRMGSHLFEPHEHDLMRGFADLSQRTPAELAEVRAAKPPKPTKVEPGESEQLAARMLGRNRSDEKILERFDSGMRKGGDIKEVARVWGQLPEANRNEIRGNWMRNLGGGEDFSIGKFVSNWEDYTNQAKAIMLNSEQRQHFNDFHQIAKEYQSNLAKYGNPSGTAQVTAWHKILTGAAKWGPAALAAPVSLFHPGVLALPVMGLGARKFAKLMATPIGPRDLSRWARVAKSYRDAPSAGKLTTLTNLARSLEASAE